MAAIKELAQASAKAAPVRPPEVARRAPETTPATPVFSIEARSNGIPAAARAVEPTSTQAGTVGRARRASSLQRTLGNARMGRMLTRGSPAASPRAAAKIPSPTQEKLESTFGAPLDFIDVHGGGAAAEANRRMGSRGFAHGHEIYLGPGESPHDTALMAHEVAHVFQQQGDRAVVQHKGGCPDTAYEREADRAAAAALRSEPVTIHERTGTRRPQFFGLGQALDFLADKANVIPGFRMFTIVLGVNPINMAPVERSAGNILRALIEFIPGGGLITQVADAYGAFDKVAGWVEPQITAVAGAASSIKSAVTDFLGTLKLSDILDLGGVWDRVKAIFTGPVNRVINVAKGLITGILALFRDIILMPLAGLASKTRGWDLLIAVLGKNPITGEPVPRTAETLIAGFLKLIGEEETWNNIKKANALARCWAWFQGALATVVGFVQQVPTLFVNALKSLELEDILLLPRAFGKVAGAFGDFVGNFIKWAGQALWNLLQIIFEIVAPGAIPYLKKVGAAFQKILKNPMGFVGNLVKAGKQGFLQFADHIGAHLKASFIEWLTGALDGVYIPKSFDFKEIAKFVLSVLGLTWENIRKILVKLVGEPAVKAMETGFDIVKALVTEGPAAAWEKIKEQLANLKDMVIQGIMDFIVETVVKKAVQKIISWLIPGAGFIDAIVSIYEAVMVFIDKLKKIIQVATAFLDSIVNIANGVIAAAANKVENTLAGLLTLAINFLAGFVGLNKIADKVNEIINTKVRAPVLKAVEFVATWIVNLAKKLGKFLLQAGVPEDPKERLNLGLNSATAAARSLGKGITRPLLQPLFSAIQLRYGLKELEAFERGGMWWARGTANPSEERNMGIVVVGAPTTDAAAAVLQPMPLVPIIFKCNLLKYKQDVFDVQLQGHETGLNKISVPDWENNRAEYLKSGRGSNVPQDEIREAYRNDLRARIPKMTDQQIEDQLELLAALHEPDLVAGGFNVVSKLGSRYINSSIGSQWRTKVSELKSAVDNISPKEDKPKYRINVRLTSQGFTP